MTINDYIDDLQERLTVCMNLQDADTFRFILDAINEKLNKEDSKKEDNQPLTKEELKVLRIEQEPIWAVELWRGDGYTLDGVSGWAIASTRSTLTQDFTDDNLWYDLYGDQWIAYRNPN